MYINYGDYNFFEYGCLVDVEHSDYEFSILYCRPYCDEENKYQFAECVVDILDSWIDKDTVMDFIGMNDGNFDKILFAIGCIEYYGIENFSSPYDGYDFTRKEIEDKLKYYLIANNNLNITW